MTTRIALCGSAGSGKSTFADYLVQTHAFTRLSIAEPVKAIGNAVADALGYPHTKGDRRVIFQAVGLGGRAFNAAFWLHALETQLGSPDQDEARYVIDDVRFPNEAAYLADVCGFTIVKVETPRELCLARLRTDAIRSGMNPVDAARKITEALFADDSEREVDAILPDLVLPNSTENDREAGFRRLDTLLAHALT